MQDRRAQTNRTDQTERRSDTDGSRNDRRDQTNRRADTGRRSDSDRRNDTDRRTNADLRQEQHPIDFPDRRASNRRKKSNRRTINRRQEWEEELPLLEWEPAKEKVGEKKKRQYLLPIISIGISTILLAAFVGYLSLPQNKPKVTKRVVREDPFKNIGKPKPKQKKVEQVEEAPLPDEIRILSENIVDIAPEIYGSVKVEKEPLPETAQRRTSRNSRKATRKTPQFVIRGIMISIKSKSWNRITGAKKVDLLHQTFDLLQARYPGITPFVTLKFDDGRQDLDLKFDDFVKKKR
ncbi:MAG: hypothetical protein QGG64_11335 [Candidatus Latescibacteria bacterium]|nr:hypothetical protein [Candidatus Latescibacterota bacterium]